MRDFVNSIVRRFIRFTRYDIVNCHAMPADVAARKRLLDGFGIDVILDIGANAGQFALSLRESMVYHGEIVSFVPLPDAFAHMRALAEQDSAWEARNVALGEAEGELKLNMSMNRVSSSFLAIRETSTAVEPKLAYESECVLKTRSPDSLLPELSVVKADSRVMLKVDTKGL